MDKRDSGIGAFNEPLSRDVVIQTGLSERKVTDELAIEIYRIYIEDTHQLRNERETVNNIRVTIVTLILGAQAFAISTSLLQSNYKDLLNPSFLAWLPVIISGIIGLVGYYFCYNWRKVISDYRVNLKFKYNHLIELENKWPDLSNSGFNLFSREEIDRSSKKEFGIGTRIFELQTFFGRVFILIPLLSTCIKLFLLFRPF